MLSIFYVFIFSFTAVFAQTTSPTLLITDQEEKTDATTFSGDIINVLDQDQALYRDTTDVLTFISNGNSSGGTNRIRFWQFRGVGESSQYENTPTHSITTLIDNVDVTGMLSHWPLLDVEQVRVEKQPASILFGGNAVGGVVETTLNRSSDDIKARATVDSRWGHGLDGSIPISNHRMSLHYNNDEGYVTNTLWDESGNSRRELYGSLVSDWVNSTQWKVQTSLLATHFVNRYDVWSIANNNETTSDRPGKDNLNMLGGAVTAQYTVSPDVSFNLWSSIAMGKSYYSYDADWSNNTYWNSIPGWNANYDYFDDFLRYRTQWQNRLSVEWKNVTVAVHASEMREDSDSRGFKNGIQRSLVVGNYSQNSLAAHAAYRYSILPATNWSVSVRTDSIRTQYKDDRGLSEQWSAPDWAIATQVQHALDNTNALFFSIRRGYKNPIINIDPDTPSLQRRVDSESAIHFETGHSFKNAEWDFSQSLFVRSGHNQHVRVSEQLIINDPSSYVYYYDNAAKTNYFGYELQGQKVWSSGRSLRASLGFLRAQFKDYSFDGQTLNGREVAHAPKNTWALQWQEPLTDHWSVVTQTEGKSSFYFSNNHGKKSAPYALMHAAVRWVVDNHQIDAGVRNIFDTDYGIRAFYFANEPPDFAEKLYSQNGSPRTFYVNYRFSFH